MHVETLFAEVKKATGQDCFDLGIEVSRFLSGDCDIWEVRQAIDRVPVKDNPVALCCLVDLEMELEEIAKQRALWEEVVS